MTDEYFGTPAQIAMMRRTSALWSLLKDHPEYGFYGRSVMLSDYSAAGFEAFEPLIRLTGIGVAYGIRTDAADEAMATLADAGLQTDSFGFCQTVEPSIDLAREVVQTHALPDDLTVIEIDMESPAADVADLAEVALAGGVLPSPGHVLRGKTVEGVVLLAREGGTGRAVACAAAFDSFKRGTQRGDHAWWGMLSTVPDRRGQKIALILGAMSMLRMYEKTGLAKFFTGIRHGNQSSSALCAKLGVVHAGWEIIVGMDPEQFSGQLTA